MIPQPHIKLIVILVIYISSVTLVVECSNGHHKRIFHHDRFLKHHLIQRSRIRGGRAINVFPKTIIGIICIDSWRKDNVPVGVFYPPGGIHQFHQVSVHRLVQYHRVCCPTSQRRVTCVQINRQSPRMSTPTTVGRVPGLLHICRCRQTNYFQRPVGIHLHTIYCIAHYIWISIIKRLH